MLANAPAMEVPPSVALRKLLLPILIATTGACASPLVMRAPGQPLPPVGRLAVMASNVEIYERGALTTEMRADWTAAGRLHVDEALRVWAAASGAQFFDDRDMVDIPLTYEQFRLSSDLALTQIAMRVEGRR